MPKWSLTILTHCAVPHTTSWLCRRDFDTQLPHITDLKAVDVLCLTWNVGESKPEGSPFFRWVAEKARSASVVVIALQEIEMGSSSIVLGAAKDALLKSAQVSSFRCRGEDWFQPRWPCALSCEAVEACCDTRAADSLETASPQLSRNCLSSAVLGTLPTSWCPRSRAMQWGSGGLIAMVG